MDVADVREAFLGWFWVLGKASERNQVDDTIGSGMRLLQERQLSS